MIVQQLHGRWTAWWESEPQLAFGGVLAAKAEVRLAAFVIPAMDGWFRNIERATDANADDPPHACARCGGSFRNLE